MAIEAIATWSGWCPRLEGIEPVDGWYLHEYEDEDSDGFTTSGYFASNGERDVFFDHCRFNFSPTQERFEYLVRRGFPRLGGIGPTQNKHIDEAIRNERALSHTKHGLSEAQATAIAWVLSA